MASRKILFPGFLALALLGLLITAPLVCADEHDDDHDKILVYKSHGKKPSGDHVSRDTIKGWKVKVVDDFEEISSEHFFKSQKGYVIKKVSFKKFDDKKYPKKAYFKVKVTKGEKTKTLEVYVKTPKNYAIFKRIFFAYDKKTLYFATYYVYDI